MLIVLEVAISVSTFKFGKKVYTISTFGRQEYNCDYLWMEFLQQYLISNEKQYSVEKEKTIPRL